MVNATLTAGGDVLTKLAFVPEGTKVSVRFVAKGDAANTSKQEERDVTITDARNNQDLTLDTAGFELVPHKTKVYQLGRNKTYVRSPISTTMQKWKTSMFQN